MQRKEENGMVLDFLSLMVENNNRSNDNGAFQHHLRVRGHIHQIQQVVDDTQDEHANNHSADVSLPPVKLVPPTTTAAMQSFARSSPLVGAPTPSRAVKRIPAIPAQTAQKI
nr:hypothetical protein [Dysosmobacter welbionis]